MKVALKAVGWTLFAVIAAVVFIVVVVPVLFWLGIWAGFRK